jgi:hypothetical protein
MFSTKVVGSKLNRRSIFSTIVFGSKLSRIVNV